MRSRNPGSFGTLQTHRKMAVDGESENDFAKYLSITLGIVKVSELGEVKPIKFTINPSLIPEKMFKELCDLQPHFNTLVDRISLDPEFLGTTLERTMKVDEFTRKLFEVYKESWKLGPKATVFGKNRCDYLINWQQGDGGDGVTMAMKQVEINTIAASYGGLSPRMVEFHKVWHSDKGAASQPEPSPSLDVIVAAMAEAWKCYGKKDAAVLFVVSKNEANIFDQKRIEFKLWEDHQVRALRYTLTELGSAACHGPKKELVVDGKEVALVYFRAGYSPDHYFSSDGTEWRVRLLLETSGAICVPSAGHHLVGCKKVQQELALPGVLERFVADADVVRRMRAVFAGLYTLDLTPEGEKAAEMAIREPWKFVMKPQKEGGGNNLYGEDVRKTLKELAGKEEREQYILMELLRSPTQISKVYINGAITEAEVIPELGIYGLYLRHNGKVVLNRSAPYLVRSKLASTNETGLSVGYGLLDSLTVVSEETFKERVHPPQVEQ